MARVRHHFRLIARTAQAALLLLLLLQGFQASIARAVNSVPKVLNYQARLTDTGGVPVPNGALNIKFIFYNGDTGACLYSVRGTCGAPAAKAVTVTNGVFSTQLGEFGDNEMPDGLFDTNTIFLGITIGADSEMTPRKRLTSAPYALNADRLDDLDTTSSGSTTAYVPSTTINGNLVLTGDPQGSGVSNGSLYVNPSSASANETLFAVADNGGSRFQLDKEGDLLHTGSLLATSASSTSQFIFRGAASPTVNLFEVQDSLINRLFTVSATGALFSPDLAGYAVGIGNGAPANRFTVGSATSTFEVNAAGNLIKVNNVPYSWPAAQGAASTVLQNNGSGTLSWTAASSLVNLNQAYLNATGTTELYVTASQGALTVADQVTGGINLGAGIGNLFEIQDRTNAAGDYSARFFSVSSTSTLLNPASNVQHYKFALGNAAPANAFTVGSATSTFEVNAAGNLIKVNNVSYSWPAAQGAASTVLQNNGSGTLSWTAASSLVNLNQAYLNATGTTELYVNSTQGALSIQDQVTGGINQGIGIGTLFEVLDRTNASGDYSARFFSVSSTSTLINPANNVVDYKFAIGNAAPANKFTVGSATSTFEINTAGNLVKINNVAYSWPASQGAASTVLQNDGSGNLSWQSVGTNSTLLQAFNNSTSSNEIYINSTQGALTIADTFSGTSNIFEIQDRTNSAGDYSRRYLTVSSTSTNLAYNNITTTTAASLTVNSLTSGTGLSITGTGTGLTGNLLLAQTASTAAFAAGGVRFNFTGAHSGVGFLIDDVTTGGSAMRINANSVTTGEGLLISANGLNASAGSALVVTSSGTYTNVAGIVSIVASGTTDGIVSRIDANALAGGSAFYVTSSSSYTGTQGVFALVSNATSGTVQSLTAGSLTSGTALSITSGSNNVTSGKLLSLTKNDSSVTANFTGALASISYTPTYTTTNAVNTGSLLSVTRNPTMNGAGLNPVIAGPVALFSDNVTLNGSGGVAKHGAAVVSIVQNFTNATGTALTVTSSATGGGAAYFNALYEPLVAAGNNPSPLSTLFAIQNTTAAGGTGYTSRYLTVSSTSTLVNPGNLAGYALGIGNAVPANRLTVGSSTSTFEVNMSGNLIKINNVPYSWPSSQGAANTSLQNNGSGTLTWTLLNLQKAYDNDVDGGDATLTMNGVDGDVIFAGDQDLRVTTTGLVVLGNNTHTVTDPVTINGSALTTGKLLQLNGGVAITDGSILSATGTIATGPAVDTGLITLDANMLFSSIGNGEDSSGMLIRLNDTADSPPNQAVVGYDLAITANSGFNHTQRGYRADILPIDWSVSDLSWEAMFYANNSDTSNGNQILVQNGFLASVSGGGLGMINAFAVAPNSGSIQNALSVSGTVSRGLSFEGADMSLDFVMQNGEVIHNDTNGVIAFTDGVNTLCTITDNNDIGDLTCTGNINVSLNRAYLNATSSAEISLTPSIGALTIADTLSGTGNIFEIQNRSTSAGDYSQRHFTVSSTSTFAYDDFIVPGRVPTTHTGSLSVGVTPYRVDLQNNFAYVVNNASANNFHVVDTSDPSAPVLTSSIALPSGSTPLDVKVGGHYAYVADSGLPGLRVVDISNVKQPVVTGSATASASVRAVAVQGRFAYGVGANGILRIFDLANPRSPYETTSSASTSGPAAGFVDVAVQGSYAYVTDNASDTLRIFNIANQNKIGETGTLNVSDEPRGIAVAGSYAYVAHAGTADTFRIYDISNPASPSFVAQLAGLNDPEDVVVNGKYAYVTNRGGNTLQIIDVSIPTLPVSVGTVTTDTNPEGLVVQGRFAYVVGTTFRSYNLKGAYLQQAEFGSAKTGNLSITNGLFADVADVRTGLTVGRSLNVNGHLAISAASNTNYGGDLGTTCGNGCDDDSLLSISSSLPSGGQFGGALINLRMDNADSGGTYGSFFGGVGLRMQIDPADFKNLFSSGGVPLLIESTTGTDIFYIQSNGLVDLTNSVYQEITNGPTGSNGYEMVLNNANFTNGFTISQNVGTSVVTTAFNASYSGIVNALDAGPNVIKGSTTTIDFDNFDVSSTGTVQLNLPLSTGNWALCHRESNGAGTLQTVVDCANAPAADYMEMYPAAQGLEMGDIVMPGATYVPTSNSGPVPQVVKTARTYEGSMIGVISNPNDAGDFNSIGHEIPADAHPLPVALKGRVKVKVNLENGAIRVGDPITSSSVPGVGMKATKPGMIVGQALTEWNGPGEGMILVFMGNGWHSGLAITTDGLESLFADNFTFRPLNVSSASGTSFGSYALRFTGSAWDAASGTAVTRTISISNEVADASSYQLAFKNQTGDVLANLNQAGDLFIKGALTVNGGFDYAETFPATPDLEPGDVVMVDPDHTTGYGVKKSDKKYENTLLGVISTKPGFLTGRSASGSQPVALAGRVPVKVNGENGPIMPGDPITSSSAPGEGMKATEAGRVIGIALEGWNQEGKGTITVFVNPSWWNGPEALSDKTSGSSLSLTDDALLDFKNATLSNVAAIISKNGAWSVTEDGYVLAEKIEAKEVQAGRLTLKANAAADRVVGRARLQAGYDALLVQNPHLTENSVIVITFEGNPGANWWISEKHDGSFMLKLAQPAISETPFTYWIVPIDGLLEPAEDDPETPPVNPGASGPETPTRSGSETPETGSGTDTPETP